MAKQAKKTTRGTSENGLFSTLSPPARDLLCIGLLYIVTLVLFRGIIFDNASFAEQGDTATAISYAHAGSELQKTEGRDVVWMPYFFSGMPTFGPVAFVPRNINYLQTYGQQILNILYLNGKWTWYIVYFLIGGVSMFFLGRVMGFSRTASLIGGLTFMLSPYAMGLPAEGHGSKLMALSYLPLVFLLTHMLFQKRNLLTFGLLSAAIGTLMLTNHMQIVYYDFAILGAYVVYVVLTEFPGPKPVLLTKMGLFAGALVIGFLISAFIYLNVYEYAQFSMRGGGTAGSTGGLTYDYATNWSFSPWEMIVFLIPGYFGLGGGQSNFYWGHIEPWNTAHVYFGLVPLVLAILAFRYRRNALTVFFGILAVLLVLLSFGRNGPYLYDLLFSVAPFFNKFRAPLMILHMLPFVMGILGAIGYDAVESQLARDQKRPRDAQLLLYAAAGFFGVFLIALVAKSTIQGSLSGFMFLREGELQQFQHQFGTNAERAIVQYKQLRFDVFWRDAMKFLLLAGLSTGLIALYFRRQVSVAFLGTALVALTLADLYLIDSRMVTPYPSSALEESFQMDPSIRYMKSQPGHFRMFPVGGQLFSDNTYAYFGLESIGGYSPAKLRIYQTLLDSCLYHGYDPQFPVNLGILNMLNVRYLVVPGRLPVGMFTPVVEDRKLITYRNDNALPRAFYVDTAIVASTDAATFAALNDPGFNPGHLAVLTRKPIETFGPPAPGTTPEITSYASREIHISTDQPKSVLLVLSEIYYPAGWKAFVDGTETPIYRTNSILRSVVVPAGKHDVSFTFNPPYFESGWIISNAAWGLSGILVLAGVFGFYRRRNRTTGSATEGGKAQGAG
jgi:hypothetical protein